LVVMTLEIISIRVYKVTRARHRTRKRKSPDRDVDNETLPVT